MKDACNSPRNCVGECARVRKNKLLVLMSLRDGRLLPTAKEGQWRRGTGKCPCVRIFEAHNSCHPASCPGLLATPFNARVSTRSALNTTVDFPVTAQARHYPGQGGPFTVRKSIVHLEVSAVTRSQLNFSLTRPHRDSFRYWGDADGYGLLWRRERRKVPVVKILAQTLKRLTKSVM